MTHALIPVINHLSDTCQYKDLLTLTTCDKYLSNNIPLDILCINKDINYISKLFKNIKSENIEMFNCNYIDIITLGFLKNGTHMIHRPYSGLESQYMVDTKA